MTGYDAVTTGDDATSGPPAPQWYADDADDMASPVSHSRREGIEVLTFSGEVDLHSVEDIAPVLEEVLEAGAGSLVLDLSAVVFADSSALNLLLRTHARTSMHLAGPLQSPVQRLFEVTGISGVLNLHDSVDEAVAAAQAQQ